MFRSSGVLLGLPKLHFGIVCVACVQHNRNQLCYPSAGARTNLQSGAQLEFYYRTESHTEKCLGETNLDSVMEDIGAHCLSNSETWL